MCINVCLCIHHLLFKKNLFSLTPPFTPKKRSPCSVQFRATAVASSMMVHIRTSCSSSGLADATDRCDGSSKKEGYILKQHCHE